MEGRRVEEGPVALEDIAMEVHDVKDLCSLSSVEQNRERRRRHSVQDASSGRSCFTIGPFGVLC